MKRFWFLPELKPDANVAPPDTAGIWHESKDKKILNQISDGISISQLELKTIVSSIPDVWARPMLFWSALRDEKHPLHEKIYNEWKALISLLALREVKGYPIKFNIVNLGKDELSNALRKLKPQPIGLQEGKKYEWDAILIIYFDDIPIGATSPATLVYTASQYNLKLKDKPISLKDENGYLTPPKSKDELFYLNIWILNFILNLQRTLFVDTRNEEDRPVIDTLLHLLSERWASKIPDALKDFKPDEAEMLNSFVEYPSSWEYSDELKGFFEDHPVYELVFRPLKLKTDEINKQKNKQKISDIAISVNKEDVEKILIIHESTLSDENNRIWGTIKLSDLGGSYEDAVKETFQGEIGTKIRNQVLPEKVIWVKPELHFFTDYLVKSDSDGKVLVDSELNNQYFIYPLKETILDYFTPQEIKEKLNPQFEIKNKDTIIFSIKIELENRKEITISKTFKTNPSKGEGKIFNIKQPILELFPDFVDDKWEHYYLFQYNIKTLNIKPFPKIFKIKKEEKKDNGEQVEKTKVKEKIEIEKFDFNERIYSNKDIKITLMKRFPQVLVVRDAKYNDPLGLIFIKTPEGKNLSGTLFAGVDLVTTNTNIWLKRDEKPSPERFEINFENHIKQITYYDQNIRREILKKFFIPPTTINFPVPTIIRIIDDKENKEFMLNTFMYFKDSYETLENLKSGFKWEEEDATLLQQYVKSILFLLLIEMKRTYNKNELNIGITYPKAFSQDQVSQYRNYWENNAKDFNVELKLKENYYNYTEGFSAGYFFKNLEVGEKAYIAKIAICLDVGGKTTDIAIWVDRYIELSASILLAGENIIDIFKIKPKLREALFSKKANEELIKVLNEPKQLASLLNIIFKREEEDIKRNLLTYAKSPEFKALRKLLSFQFSAISFYTGMLLAYLIKRSGTNIIDKLRDGITLHWGGNGAKFLSWITFGKFEKEGTAVKLLNSIFQQAVLSSLSEEKSSLEGIEVEQFQSPGPKDEASKGVLYILDEIKGKIEDEIKKMEKSEMQTDDIMCGENIVLSDGRELNSLDPINKTLLFKDDTTLFKETKLTKLEEFVKLFNELCSRFGMIGADEKIQLDDKTKTILKLETYSNFKDMERMPDTKRVVEPVFITEVKTLIKLINK
jgi:hypothetical protein